MSFNRPTVPRELAALLRASRASEAFKQAVTDFARGRPSDRIRFSSGSPPIKVLRVLMKVLEVFPDAAISGVDIQGQSTCSSYYGVVTIEPGPIRVRFNWDCSWKAQEEGMRTWYGAPDQTGAAHKFGYQCFETFERVDHEQ